MSLTDTFTPKTTLRNLVQILHDGQKGFKHASENVKDSNLKRIFSGYSLQRSQFAGEIENLLLGLGEEDPQKTGSTLAGAVHRGWIDLKAAFTKEDNHAILAEAERGEDAAVAAYKDAIEQDDMPANIVDVLEKQMADVENAHDEIKALRDASAK